MVINFARQNLIIYSLLNYIEKYKLKKEKDYRLKLEFLKYQAYEHFLNYFLNKESKNNKNVDFPPFMYKRHFIIHENALKAAENAVKYTAVIHGKRHIEKCFDREFKKLLEKNELIRKNIIKNLYKK